MNLFQLVFKQMRQRALSTWLTLLSVLLGVGLATAILLFLREGPKLFGQTDFGYDTIIGPKGDKLQLVLTTAYHIGASSGTTIPYSYYENFPDMTSLEWIVPCLIGDNYQGYRIVGTLPKMFMGFGHEQDAVVELILKQEQLVAHPQAKEQQSLRDRAKQVLGQIRINAPDAAARLEEAIAAMDSAIAPMPTDTATTRPADPRAAALESLRATAVLLGGPAEYRRGKAFELADGRVFDPRKFEAVVGSEVAQRGGLKIGSTFRATHGAEESSRAEEHHEQWTVVGVLQPTYTANDRAIFIPLVSGYAIPAHEAALRDIAALGGEHGEEHDSTTHPTTARADEHGHHDHEEAYTLGPDGTINLRIPRSEWRVAAILARTKGSLAMGVQWGVNNGSVAMAANPSGEMLSFFKVFLTRGSYVLLFVSLLVTVVASVSILVSIYNSVAARRKEIAILRALGATRTKVLAIICIEAGLVGLFGGVAGLVVGHLLGAGGSLYLKGLLGEGIAWLSIDQREGLYLLAVVVLAVLAGLVPATKAYRTPVATNLVAS